MAERNDAGMTGVFGWRLVILCAIAIVAANGLALLLIPQLSVRAAVRGGSIALGTFLFIQLGARGYARFRQRSRRG